MQPIFRRIEPIIGLVVLGFVVIGCFIVLRPFVTSLLLAAILAFATWPAFGYLQHRTGFGVNGSAFLMSALVALALLTPLFFIGTSLADDAAQFVEEMIQAGLPPPPAWLEGLPYVGPWAADIWRTLAAQDLAFSADLTPYLEPFSDAVVSSGLSIGRGLLELILSLIIIFFFYRDGEVAAARLTAINRRIFGHRAEQLQSTVAGTVRSVIYGVLGTALVQGVVAAFGYSFSGLPAPLFLAFLTFLLALLPIGPPFVWIPAVIWLFTQGSYPAAIFLGVYGFFVISGIDNILKPYLISKGSDLPLIIVFLGLFGGIAAFGFLGIFLGPTLLALGFVLVRELSAPDEHGNQPATAVPAQIDGPSKDA